MRKTSIFLVFLLAPVLSILLLIKGFPAMAESLIIPTNNINDEINVMRQEAESLGDIVFQLAETVNEQQQVFAQQDEKITKLTSVSSEQKHLSDDIYEQKILKILGPARYAYLSDYSEIKIFDLAELGYRGCIAKIKLFDPSVFKVVLAQDTLGKLETTSSAAKRNNAILAINGGGFYVEERNGASYAQMIGNTVIDGKLVEPFKNDDGLFFAGINKNGELIGSVPKNQGDLMALNPYQGVSFLPVLLKESVKMPIPEKWRTTKQPRTIIGKYANDDLIMIVIDGRQNDWSLGVTLERLQDKLLELGVKDAYNLDGGGSSAMYYKGQILNRPSEGRERPVVNNIVILR
ncbi:MAG TPA: phosphodiester glycosidase family protein [Peptococcaceae bacterium]|nr:phosphodiester glycosidase family protein [Peptococcaceae bacterium]